MAYITSWMYFIKLLVKFLNRFRFECSICQGKNVKNFSIRRWVNLDFSQYYLYIPEFYSPIYYNYSGFMQILTVNITLLRRSAMAKASGASPMSTGIARPSLCQETRSLVRRQRTTAKNNNNRGGAYREKKCI